ncbi:MAG TPA: bifunctional hydroxymethylpyrimidine kinase/phosphomethylpyrimidine kinase [Bryobacteraceae bacterium]|nr:bifunctional hydroxymethylpyrimidine kinase/phosphomethylpyrimidine kinase [Bryobacterales bacterium]HRJ21109.1 bifunctional hydroxymethylpyrimidine kinase/phosphomethylpyrimidine kinase [Bryobacteraceae bacterium]
MKPVALSIAGSDPSGGAGIQADLKTFHQFGVYGEAVLTLLTVQNTTEVASVHLLDPGLVVAQIRAVLIDIPPQAVKTGALGNASIIRAVAAVLAEARLPLVVDPVMISKHGASLIADEAREVLLAELLPLATLVTPNLPEAEALTGLTVDSPASMKDSARALNAATGAAILVKGGHLQGAALDLLFDGATFHEFTSERLWTPNTHGTGCTYSAAITAALAIGLELPEAVERAKSYITEAIRTNPGLGRGAGPVNHHVHPIQ